jgi:hypothetical protein
MPIGAGLYPAGLGLAGYGTPAQAPFSLNAPLPDPTTGLSLTGRLINQKTGDYVMQADGRLQGMPTVEQLVLLAIENIDTSDIQEKTPNLRAMLADRVEKSLAPLIRAKQVLIRQIVVVEPNQDAVVALLDWVDLTTGAPVQTPIG